MILLSFPMQTMKNVFSLPMLPTLSPCQGNDPLLKYMRTYPRLSMSSRRDCSIPRWALIEAYLRRRKYLEEKKQIMLTHI